MPSGKQKEKKKKETWVDDGRTIVNMNIPGMRGYRADRDDAARRDGGELSAPKGRQATPFRTRCKTFWRAFVLVLPVALIGLLGFGLAALLVWLWLH